MKQLEDKILHFGKVYEGKILKVDSFLNHQIDVRLMDQIGVEFYHLFQNRGITKILTIEASGIAVACMTAKHFGLPVVFAKKARSLNLGEDVYTSMVHSYTYQRDYMITISKEYLKQEDCVLIVDDFLANGKAMQGMLDICCQAGANVVGIGICIEKAFQNGGNDLRLLGYDVKSLAIIEDMKDGKVIFSSKNKNEVN